MSNEIKSVSNEPAVHPYPPGASNVLLLASSIFSSDAPVCAHFLTRLPGTEVAVLQIDFTRSSVAPFSIGATSAENPVQRYRHVSVGHRAGLDADHVPQASSMEVECTHIRNGGNLTEIGVEITDTVSEWNRHPAEIGVCFHSLTPLCQYADLNRVYRFLHVVTGHLTQEGARAHYHMDPKAHDDRTISTLQTLFDAVVHVDEEGTAETIQQ